jgi:glycosyltransferase involved in cell wall biosynthesis
MNKRPTIHLFADVLGGFGGIETYLDALARRLATEQVPVRIAVSLNSPAPFLNELELLGISVYKQPAVPGDRWCVRQRLLVRHVARHVKPGDWVFCVRQPMPAVYLPLVRAIHRQGGKVAASWMFAPEYLPAPPGALGKCFKKAISETDAVISVSECTRHQFADMYDYSGPIKVVRYHNIERLHKSIPIPSNLPICIGFIGRIAVEQKNLDTIIKAYQLLVDRRDDVVFNFYGGGEIDALRSIVAAAGLEDVVRLHGHYDHRRDLPKIMAKNHLFVYTSRFEGGPCFSLLELLQAGRFVVTSPVGGIPDIYSGRPDIGVLVSPSNPDEITAALDHAIDRFVAGEIDPDRIRSVYESHFTDDKAHGQWLEALGLLKSNIVK